MRAQVLPNPVAKTVVHGLSKKKAEKYGKIMTKAFNKHKARIYAEMRKHRGTPLSDDELKFIIDPTQFGGKWDWK